MNERSITLPGNFAAHEHRRTSAFGRPTHRKPGHRATLPVTTDLSALKRHRVLVIVDEDNLRISMQNRGRKLSYRRLLDRVQSVADEVFPLAVLTAPPNDTQREQYLQSRGWSTLTVLQETVRTWNGTRTMANADMDICFEAGRAALNWGGDVVVIGSGDGDLSTAIARGLKRAVPGKKVFTLSVPGCSSHRLLDRKDLFDGNLQIGLDLTRPNGGSQHSILPMPRKHRTSSHTTCNLASIPKQTTP
jgi:uncharacterized LabA/DUF88 family protein